MKSSPMQKKLPTPPKNINKSLSVCHFLESDLWLYKSKESSNQSIKLQVKKAFENQKVIVSR